MKEEEILSSLEKLLDSLGIELRYEKGDFTGGYCLVKEKPMMIINSALAPAQRIRILARELAQMKLENVFIVPALRQVLEDALATNAASLEGQPQNGISLESV
ncbi:MAG: ImmA/IrrE family metallo-endopeptidase [candidate division KSB1 bacterium]|nr:ImmA/IrrE family metallo-endopeptidase [candidate division KSB1 bacterium]MDZ7273782.1 ImmA/IrrE family metallo-endopeptidase [candidate division KSB1 bacterium]MDZ7285938.1 ImmA/IrrE family metallo-endopeptidase [candidate division KSB1 bacterium]MDZ7298970.1 ImmA/IrrE family metallo-endopeptidase [candidate division KSB1 bacterium]MDZ7309486.1 ImmA/IrrE family metallo-endopeptidase [candidate division KSB1 bacterium]